MYSRIILAVLSVTALASCDVKIGDEPPEQTVYEFDGTQCISNLYPALNNYFEGKAKIKEITAAWDCVIGAANQFKKYVRGKNETEYTSQEIATFLERNFLNPKEKQKISPELQLQFMKLKQLIVGGRVDVIDRKEIDDLTDFMTEMKQISIDLAPHMKILAMKWSISSISDIEKDIRLFEEGNETLQVSARKLATLIEKNGLSYNLGDFETLILEVQKFFKADWKLPKTIQRYMPVIKKIKKALAGGEESTISAKEWRRFSVLGSRGYIQYLRYYYFILSAPETGSAYKLSYLSRTLEDILSVFQELVETKPEGIVTRDEVYDLLKTLELVNSDFKISEQLVIEVMKVKQLFFGGKDDSFSSDDFNNARLKIKQVKMLIERFLPYYLIYGGDWDPSFYDRDEAEKIFKQSRKVLENSLREAGSLFEGAYDLKDLSRLIRELEDLYGVSLDNSSANTVQKYIPLAIELKKLILGGDTSVVKKSEWNPVLGFTAQAYSLYLYYGYFLDKQNIQKLPVLGSWGTLVDDGIDFVSALTKTKSSEKFSIRELTKVGEQLTRAELLPKNINRDSLGQVLDLVLNRVLVEPKRRLRGYEPDALNADSLEVLRKEFYVWHQTELWLNRVSRNAGSKGISNREFLRQIQGALKDKSDSKEYARAEALAEFAATVSSPVPLTFDSRSRVTITNGPTPRLTADALILLNLQRTASRILLRAFVNDSSRIKKLAGATQGELERAFSKLRPLLINLGVVDELSRDFVASRFREANMFTPHGNGDGYMSFAETMDMAGMIWSGLKIHNLIRKELAGSCMAGRGQGTNEYYLKLDCTLAVYHKRTSSHLSNLPVYVAYTRLAPDDMWSNYMVNIYKAAGHVPNKQGYIATSHIALAPHVLQYVEMIYARFDSDKNGIINRDESLQAYPAFEGVLLELAKNQLKDGSIKEKDLVSVFTYILKFGKPPETISEKLYFVTSWRGQPSKWDIRADRNKLAGILGYIADQVAKQKKPSFDYEN